MNNQTISKLLESSSDSLNSPIVPVILSGGSGTRLWPASRKLRPKPFIRLDECGNTLFGKTLNQLKNLNIEKVLTVTNEKLIFLNDDILKKYKELHKKTNYILEPFGRNTAPAILLAALNIAETVSEDTIMLVLSADHLIKDTTAFQNAISQAILLASHDKLVTFGITPTAPSTGFGYIQYDPETHSVTAFKEKPDSITAQKYIDNGYLWNAGIFCFKAGTLISEFQKTNEELYNKLLTCHQNLRQKNEKSLAIPEEFFQDIDDISIDYAVMEKSEKVAVIPCDIGWSDIGSWSALSQLSEVDKNQNSITENTIHINSRNVFVRNLSTKRLVTTIGLENLLVIDTPDALLIADKKHDQQVKELVSQIQKKDCNKVEFHQTVNRPWGTYTVLEEDPHYKIKRIVVKPGESLSLQMHHHRSEHWVVVSGVATIVNGDSETLVHPNESTYIPAGQQHRLTNPGVIDCVLIEVQVGSYLGEDDIVRFTDVYGRK